MANLISEYLASQVQQVSYFISLQYHFPELFDFRPFAKRALFNMSALLNIMLSIEQAFSY